MKLFHYEGFEACELSCDGNTIFRVISHQSCIDVLINVIFLGKEKSENKKAMNCLDV